jgi:hypothetical protein
MYFVGDEADDSDDDDEEGPDDGCGGLTLTPGKSSHETRKITM